jgi:hypothetical protein
VGSEVESNVKLGSSGVGCGGGGGEAVSEEGGRQYTLYVVAKEGTRSQNVVADPQRERKERVSNSKQEHLPETVKICINSLFNDRTYDC